MTIHSRVDIGSRAAGAAGPPGRMTTVALLLASTLTVLAGTALTPVAYSMQRTLGLGPTALGLVLTCHAISLVVSSFAMGRAVDRYGTRTVLVLGLGIYGLAGGAAGIAPDVIVFVSLRLIFGVGTAAVFAASATALAQQLSGPARDRVLSLRAVATSAGGVAFPLAGGLLGTISWRAPCAIFLAALPLAFIIRRDRAVWSRPVLPDIPAETAGPRLRLTRVLAVQAAAGVLLTVILIYVPLRVAELGDTSTTTLAMSPAIMSGAMAAAGGAYSSLRRRADDRTLILSASLAWALALGAAATAQHLDLLLIASAVFGAGMGVAVPALFAQCARLTPPADHARSFARLTAATFAGQAIGPALVGPVAAHWSTSLGLAVAAIAALGVTLYAALPVRSRERTAHD